MKHGTCVICQDCFEKGDHKNHKGVRLNRQISGGICDCGDPDSWKESGFCSDHIGYEGCIGEMLEKVPANYQKQAELVLANVCSKLKTLCLKIQSRSGEEDDDNGD